MQYHNQPVISSPFLVTIRRMLPSLLCFLLVPTLIIRRKRTLSPICSPLPAAHSAACCFFALLVLRRPSVRVQVPEAGADGLFLTPRLPAPHCLLLMFASSSRSVCCCVFAFCWHTYRPQAQQENELFYRSVPPNWRLILLLRPRFLLVHLSSRPGMRAAACAGVARVSEAGAASGGVLLKAGVGDRRHRVVAPRVDGFAADFGPAQGDRRRR